MQRIANEQVQSVFNTFLDMLPQVICASPIESLKEKPRRKGKLWSTEYTVEILGYFLGSHTMVACTYENESELRKPAYQRVYQYLKRHNSTEDKQQLDKFIFNEERIEGTSQDWIQTLLR